MTTLRPDDAGLVRTSTYDVPPGHVVNLVAGLTRACEAVAAERRRGLLASTVLVSRAAPGAEDAPVRVVHLARWASVDLADASRAALTLEAGDAQGPLEHDLELREMRTAGELRVELRDGEPPAMTFLISMDSEPSQHEYLLTLNLHDTEAVFSMMPGFVAGTFFSDALRGRLFEVVQWKTMGDFFAAASSPGFAEHNALINQRCHATDARPYDVVHTTEENPWPRSPKTQD